MLSELTPQHFFDVIQLANAVHGENYLDTDILLAMYQQGIKNGINASFIAVDVNEKLVGYRISFAAGQWQPDKWCSEALWPVALNNMAYFKSVSVDPAARGKGVASALLNRSIQALQAQGATAGVAHIWRESPGNAAERYFSHAGGTVLNVHPNRWQHLSAQGYICPRCGTLCCCSAAEMVLMFEEGT